MISGTLQYSSIKMGLVGVSGGAEGVSCIPEHNIPNVYLNGIIGT